MKRRKQNHKISFHFLSGSPTPPAENGLVRKFLVLVRDRREREARHVRFTTESERTIWERATTRSARASVVKILWILLVQCSNLVQKTPQVPKPERQLRFCLHLARGYGIRKAEPVHKTSEASACRRSSRKCHKRGGDFLVLFLTVTGHILIVVCRTKIST